MQTLAMKINYMLEHLQEKDQLRICEIVKIFLLDDVATPDGLEAIEQAHLEFERGETVSHNDIN